MVRRSEREGEAKDTEERIQRAVTHARLGTCDKMTSLLDGAVALVLISAHLLNPTRRTQCERVSSKEHIPTHLRCCRYCSCILAGMTQEFYAETALPKILDHIVSVKDVMCRAHAMLMVVRRPLTLNTQLYQGVLTSWVVL